MSVSGVNVGDRVEIILSSDPTKTPAGVVAKIFPDSGDGRIIVLLKNGDKGRVIRVTNSEEAVKDRIMSENQHTENKECFYEDVMRNEVIPKTVQSFLNSEGGYLYVGVGDTGTLEERLVGLGRDFEQIPDYENKTDDKLCDELSRRMMDAFDKRLESDTALGPLIEIRFVDVSGTQIAEIRLSKSPEPWFFRHLTKNNRPQSFELWSNKEKKDERVLDDFYIRHGGGKKRLDTHKEFYTYVKDHFKT